MKKERQGAIVEIIKERRISTQDELIEALNERGYKATQATVSRDIRELHLVKTAAGGESRYAVRDPAGRPQGRSFLNVFRETVLSVAPAGSIIVIKCHSGMGNAACEALDVVGFPEIVGTIAGDNTIFAATGDDETAVRVTQKINELLG